MTPSTTMLMLAASAFTVLFSPAGLHAQQCRPAIVNGNCTIALDREAIVKPLAVQVRSDAMVTVRIGKRPLERILFEAEFRDSERPDAGAAVFQALSGNLAALVLNVAANAGGVPPAGAAAGLAGVQPASVAAQIRAELIRIGVVEDGLEADLAGLRTAQQVPAGRLDEWTGRRAGAWAVAEFNTAKEEIRCQVLGTGAGCGAAGRLVPSSRAVTEAIKAVVRTLNNNRASISAADLSDLETRLMAADQRLKALDNSASVLATTREALVAAARTLALINHSSTYAEPYLLRAAVDDQDINALGVGRCADTKVTSQDLLTKEKKLLITLSSVCWGESRWEMSAGALFSAFPNRTFQAAPIIRDGQPVRLDNDPTKKILTQLQETSTRPTVVPMALAHYRLSETSLKGRRVAVMLTGGAGVNPYTKAADFGAGLSLALRGLVLTPLVHFGRDQRLTQGLYVGQQLGADPPALSTERYWVLRFGFAVSYRLPIK